MRIVINSVSEGFFDRVHGELKDMGARYKCQDLDAKSILLAPITWPRIACAENWNYSVFADQELKMLLIRANTKMTVPGGKISEVAKAIRGTKGETMGGTFSIGDGRNSIQYLFGPFCFDESQGELWDALDTVGRDISQFTAFLTTLLPRNLLPII